MCCQWVKLSFPDQIILNPNWTEVMKCISSIVDGPNELKTSKEVKLVGVKTNKLTTINCSAECNPDCIITWRKDKQTNITASTVFDTLYLNMSEHDNGNYTCLAENPKNDSYMLSKRLSIYINCKYGSSHRTLPLYMHCFMF